MAIKFGDVNGKAKKGVEQYAFKDGDNVLRIFGDVLPRYVYWLKSKNGKDIPLECLSFDRKEEKFTNKEVDHVRKHFPDLKCGWAYAVNGIADGKVIVVNLKKKLFEQILGAAEDLGDPTDPVTGWDIHFKKVKTGSMAFNVEYTLQVLRCKKRPLTEAELALIAVAKPIDEAIPRLTADQQRDFIKDNILDNESGEEAPADLGTPSTAKTEEVDDIPF